MPGRLSTFTSRSEPRGNTWANRWLGHGALPRTPAVALASPVTGRCPAQPRRCHIVVVRDSGQVHDAVTSSWLTRGGRGRLAGSVSAAGRLGRGVRSRAGEHDLMWH